jgi:hypothetical protein
MNGKSHRNIGQTVFQGEKERRSTRNQEEVTEELRRTWRNRKNTEKSRKQWL